MNRKYLIKLLAVSIIICGYYSTVSAQGFKGIMDKLDALEKRLVTLELNMKNVKAKFPANTSKIIPEINAVLDKSFKADIEKNINDLSLRLDEVSLVQGENQGKLVAYEEKVENIKEEYSSLKNNGNPDVLLGELRGLITELRSTIKEKAVAEPAPEVEAEEEQLPDDDEESSFINAGVDFMSRYVWRGMDFGNNPSLQPGLSFTNGGFEVGFWGAYTFTSNASGADENDIWMSYTKEAENSVSFSVIVTDYYFPNAGTEFFNFNNHDDPEGGGAHTFEVGFALSAPELTPFSFSAYVNAYNDPGNNTYFELAYSTDDLSFFLGGAGGSKDNPGYYGTEKFSIINLGVSAGKELKLTDHFSLPLSFSYIVNPKLEQSYLVVGISF